MDIAVVDDEMAIREHICEMIENRKSDCNVACFSSGEELLAAAKLFDIIFLDIQMDGMNGVETAKEVREKNADTVLIFITGIKEYVFEALDLYAFHYLIKPVTKQKLTEVFEQASGEAGMRKMRRKKQIFVNTRNEVTRLFDRLYEDSLSGRISNDNFTRLIDKYQTEQEQLLGQIQSLENALQEVKDSQTNAVQWAALMADYVGIQELTAENLNLLVERIEVFDRAEADGEAEQVIRICYRFGGYIGERRFKAKVLRNMGG